MNSVLRSKNCKAVGPQRTKVKSVTFPRPFPFIPCDTEAFWMFFFFESAHQNPPGTFWCVSVVVWVSVVHRKKNEYFLHYVLVPAGGRSNMAELFQNISFELSVDLF